VSRSVPEWIGATDDAEIPRLVKLRIWEREGGRCYLTGRKIKPGDDYEFEHVIALECGGQHRESNIRLALSDAHKQKTARDHNAASKIKRLHAKHNGYWPKSKCQLKSRPFGNSRPPIPEPR
jgi:5-methylcytosine-specific restriction endonuclease McrA